MKRFFWSWLGWDLVKKTFSSQHYDCYGQNEHIGKVVVKIWVRDSFSTYCALQSAEDIKGCLFSQSGAGISWKEI